MNSNHRNPFKYYHILIPYGGADGELAASLRYLSQKFTMVTPEARATLNDIATEESAHGRYP
ncbi:MAG: manganese containing catalase [Epulopiscium sp.]|nr:manganese containing catalase [Candidatus Epulonipiscium sp.]